MHSNHPLTFFLLPILLLAACSPSSQVVPSGIQPTYPEPHPTRSMPEPVVLERWLLGTDRGEVATSVIELDDGGFMIAGYEYTHADNVATWDWLVMRLSAGGEEIWKRTSAHSGEDYAWAVRSTNDGSYILAGTIESEDGDLDGFMQKFDADGAESWTITYGGEGDEIFWTADRAPDGGFFLLGQTDSIGAGGFDFFLVRTDSDGNELWSHAYGGANIDRAFGIGVTDDGKALLAGFQGQNTRNMNILFMQVDGDGGALWQERLAGDRFDVAHDVLPLPDGGFVISGYTSSFGPRDHDGFLMRLAEHGRMLWMRLYGDIGDDRVLHVDTMPDGGYALVGYSDLDVVVWRVDENGNLLWIYRDEGLLSDVGRDVIVTEAGRIVVVGGNRSENPPLDDIIVLILGESAQP